MLEIKKNTVKAETICSKREAVITFHTEGLGAFCGFLVVDKEKLEDFVSGLNTGLCAGSRDSLGVRASHTKEK